MTVSVWRIATETPTYAANDMTGIGAKITGGCWNSKGTAMVYCSENIALAALETVHYMASGGLPFNRFLIKIEIPDAVWDNREVLKPLPGGWDAIPAGTTAKHTGDAWAIARAEALLVVPSVMIPDECNILVNPNHVDAKKIVATTIKKWIYDSRFFP